MTATEFRSTFPHIARVRDLAAGEMTDEEIRTEIRSLLLDFKAQCKAKGPQPALELKIRKLLLTARRPDVRQMARQELARWDKQGGARELDFTPHITRVRNMRRNP